MHLKNRFRLHVQTWHAFDDLEAATDLLIRKLRAEDFSVLTRRDYHPSRNHERCFHDVTLLRLLYPRARMPLSSLRCTALIFRDSAGKLSIEVFTSRSQHPAHLPHLEERLTQIFNSLERELPAHADRCRGVLLDIDGTLIDSNDAHAQSWLETLEKYADQCSFHVSYPEVRKLIGMGGDKLLPKLSGIEAGSDLGKRILDERSRLFLEKYLPGLKPFPKARELLQALESHGMKLGVATSASQEELNALLQVAGIRDLISSSTSKDDAKSSKPDPDIVAAAAREIALPRSTLVLLGDTPYDVEAALRAEVPSIALRCGGWDDPALAKAVAIYDDPADLLAHLDDSPFFNPRFGLCSDPSPGQLQSGR